MPDILDPKVDLAFKKVFGSQENKTILLSFLNAVLNWTGEQQIIDVKILNPYLEPESIDDSVGILDIKLQLENNDLVDVEMQIGNLGNMERRSTYYVCRMFGDQNISNGRYQYLNRVIAINVLDFTRIKHIKRYHSIFRLRETQDNIDLTNAIEIHFIELPKLKLEMASYTNPLDRWVVFLKGGWDMELINRLAKEDPAIGKAKQVLEQMASNPRERELYELRRKAILDRNSALFEAKLEGKLEGKFETARAALLKGADVEFVAEITGLSLDEVQKLKVE
ncbi:Rpn family recombination-promoting nuclease/putative transposase [Syntrophomonas wolfei]|uniref:Rpn family recombination-promoting nuclease/putative transposase n=1 Tax=Syntrophomonas wolfei TaxID=863 RepID=UPI0013661680|nr:Rpn family recombination-promoting nuclease/putative transposase [Syntrophomonas wolfei]